MTEQQAATLEALRRRADYLEKFVSWYPTIAHLPARADQARSHYEMSKRLYEREAAP